MFYDLGITESQTLKSKYKNAGKVEIGHHWIPNENYELSVLLVLIYLLGLPGGVLGDLKKALRAIRTNNL